MVIGTPSKIIYQKTVTFWRIYFEKSFSTGLKHDQMNLLILWLFSSFKRNLAKKYFIGNMAKSLLRLIILVQLWDIMSTILQWCSRSEIIEGANQLLNVSNHCLKRKTLWENYRIRNYWGGNCPSSLPSSYTTALKLS